MKNLALLLSLAVVSLGFSSCCSMFGIGSQSAGYRTETRQVKTCRYDIVTEVVHTPGSAKSGKGGMTQTIEKKVPRYKNRDQEDPHPLRFLRPFLLPEKGLLRHHFRVHHEDGHRPRSHRQPAHRPDSHHEAARSLSHGQSGFPSAAEHQLPALLFYPPTIREKTGNHSLISHPLRTFHIHHVSEHRNAQTLGHHDRGHRRQMAQTSRRPSRNRRRDCRSGNRQGDHGNGSIR